MTQQRRFIASITATAKAGTPRLPFERGTPRAKMIARRKATATGQSPRTLRTGAA